MPGKRFKKSFKGFTLSELLIALAILGVIATFTIPKVLQSQADSKYKAMAKEAAAMLSEAYQEHLKRGLVTDSTAMKDLTPYLNYVKIASSGSVDSWNGDGTQGCGPTDPCVYLHNGAVMLLDGAWFNGNTTTNFINAYFDPDGVPTGTVKATEIYVLRNGRVATQGSVGMNVCNAQACPYTPVTTSDPSWFSWN